MFLAAISFELWIPGGSLWHFSKQLRLNTACRFSAVWEIGLIWPVCAGSRGRSECLLLRLQMKCDSAIMVNLERHTVAEMLFSQNVLRYDVEQFESDLTGQWIGIWERSEKKTCNFSDISWCIQISVGQVGTYLTRHSVLAGIGIGLAHLCCSG